MRRSTSSVLAILLLAGAPAAFAQESCPVRWEFKIVDLAATTDKLIQRAPNRGQASSQLLAVLNRLGGQGWDLVSDHEVAISFENDDPEQAAQTWVAELRPSTALLKRQQPCR